MQDARRPLSAISPSALSQHCEEHDGQHETGLLRGPRRRAGKPTTRRSRRPTASWPCSIIPTATSATRKPKRSSRKRPRPTTSCAIRTNGSATTATATPASTALNVPHFNDAQSVFDLFGDLFGDFFGGGGRARPAAGPRPARSTSSSTWSRRPAASRKTHHHPARGAVHRVLRQRRQRGTQPADVPALQRPRRRHPEPGLLPHPADLPRLRRPRRRSSPIRAPTCHGHGRVDGRAHAGRRRSRPASIPARAIRLSGEGEAGDPAAPRGDLYCVIRVREHPLFHRDGTQPDLPGADHLQPGGARRRDRGADARRADRRTRSSAASQSGDDGPHRRHGHARRCARRPQGRSARAGRRRDAAAT